MSEREFIKIKDGSGRGEMILRVSLILRVYDRADGSSTVTYGENLGGNGTNCEVFTTASTAAEVLEAIEGKRKGGCPVNFVVHRTDGTVERIENGAIDWHNSIAPVVPTNTRGREKSHTRPLMPSDMPQVGKGLCICKETAGDNQECPMHHLPSRLPKSTTVANRCNCLINPGDNLDCPEHGEATAWDLLHRG